MTKIIFRFTSAFVAFLGLAHAQQLFVSSSGDSEVIEYNGQTGVPIGVFASGGGLSAAFGIVFGPDGNLYVASFNNEVIEYNGQTGAFIRVFASGGGLDVPIGIVFGPNGNLYVASSNNNEVIEYNGQTGAFISVFASGNGLNGPAGIVFGPDGNLYVSSSGSNAVIEYSGQTGAYIRTFSTSPGPTGLNIPLGIAFGPDGNLYVASNSNDAVIEFNSQTGAYSEFVTGIAGPDGLVFGPDGNLYVASPPNNDVIEYNGQTGNPIGMFVTMGSGGLSGPTYLVFSPPTSKAFQVRYFANLVAGDSYINLTNDGSTGGNICVNVYAFDPAEELVACCACNLTPNALQSLSVKTDLLSNTLTPATPTSLTVKLMSTSNTGATISNCNAASPDGLAPALEAWGSTLHATPQGTYSTTETQFATAGLSAAELTQITGTCGFIQSNASGYGICKSCQPGGLGATKQ